MYPSLNLFHGIEKIIIKRTRECGFAMKNFVLNDILEVIIYPY